MKIAIIVWDLSTSGGTQRQALELARYLQCGGHEVKVYCAYLLKDRCYPHLIEAIDVESLFAGKYSDSHSTLRSGFLYPLEPLCPKNEISLANMMDSDFDIVNPHEHRSFRVAYYYTKRQAKPCAWVVNDVPRSMIHSRYGAGWTRSLDIVHYLAMGGPLGYLLDRERIRRCVRLAVVLDKSSKERLKQDVGIDVVQMPSGLDIASFPVKHKESCCGARRLKLLAVGIFFPHRRFEDLAHAMDILRTDGYEVTLDIVGSEAYDPSYARRIRRLVRKLNLSDYVRFLGYQSEESLRSMYAGADVFLFPNSPQTWGLAVFEAMASGTPVVVSTGSGASSILRDRDNALLVAARRPSEIAACIRLLCQDNELYSRLSASGRRFVEKNVTWDIYGERMHALLCKVVDDSGRPPQQ